MHLWATVGDRTNIPIMKCNVIAGKIPQTFQIIFVMKLRWVQNKGLVNVIIFQVSFEYFIFVRLEQ